MCKKSSNFARKFQTTNIMKAIRLATLLFAVSAMLVSCTQQAPISIHWEMGKNDVKPGVCELYYTITNHPDRFEVKIPCCHNRKPLVPNYRKAPA